MLRSCTLAVTSRHLLNGSSPKSLLSRQVIRRISPTSGSTSCSSHARRSLACSAVVSPSKTRAARRPCERAELRCDHQATLPAPIAPITAPRSPMIDPCPYPTSEHQKVIQRRLCGANRSQRLASGCGKSAHCVAVRLGELYCSVAPSPSQVVACDSHRLERRCCLLYQLRCEGSFSPQYRPREANEVIDPDPHHRRWQSPAQGKRRLHITFKPKEISRTPVIRNQTVHITHDGLADGDGLVDGLGATFFCPLPFL